MKLYVGNLSLETAEAQLRELFGHHGEVRRARLALDKVTGKPRGFGFIEFADRACGVAAIAALDGKSVGGRDIKVKEAKPRPPAPPAVPGGGEPVGG